MAGQESEEIRDIIQKRRGSERGRLDEWFRPIRRAGSRYRAFAREYGVPCSHPGFNFAPTKEAGSIMIFLRGGGGQPACPAGTSGTFTGTITAANVVGPTAQGISAGDLTSALKAIRKGNAYTNIHTTNFPGGEIRGQVKRNRVCCNQT